MPTYDADIIVIGSGFGGSVAALRAAEAGMRVVVLERGRRMTDEGWRAMGRGERAVFRTRGDNGLVDIHARRGLFAATGNAVGGGSNVYTAVTIPPRPEIFAKGWPDGFDAETLAHAVQRVEAVIRPRPIVTELPRLKKLADCARALNGEFVRLPLALRDGCDAPTPITPPTFSGLPNELSVWLRGGLHTAKQPLTGTYLARAEAAGAEIRAEHEVTLVAPDGHGFRVYVDQLSDGTCRPTILRARRVVLAAGTLGTVRLLLQCRDVHQTLPNISRQLGHRFFTNGDFGALLLAPDGNPAYDDGPPVTAWIDLWEAHRLFLMDVGFLPLTVPGKRRPWLFGVMGFAPIAGRLALDRRQRLRHDFPAGEYEAFRVRALRLLRNLATAADARLIPVPGAVFRRAPVTVHPLGGAAMADASDRGAVDRFGEVFGYRGLFIADGSILPTPIGTAPSMTIAALAEHIMEHLVRQ